MRPFCSGRVFGYLSISASLCHLWFREVLATCPSQPLSVICDSGRYWLPVHLSLSLPSVIQGGIGYLSISASLCHLWFREVLATCPSQPLSVICDSGRYWLPVHLSLSLSSVIQGGIGYLSISASLCHLWFREVLATCPSQPLSVICDSGRYWLPVHLSLSLSSVIQGGIGYLSISASLCHLWFREVLATCPSQPLSVICDSGRYWLPVHLSLSLSSVIQGGIGYLSISASLCHLWFREVLATCPSQPLSVICDSGRYWLPVHLSLSLSSVIQGGIGYLSISASLCHLS